MAIYDRVCRTCGVSFRGGPRAWYCPDCRRERERERKKRYNRGEFARHIGQKDYCLNCGEEYTVESGLQKYCTKCQPIMHRKLDNEQGTAYYHNNVDKAERSVKRRKYYAEHKDELNRKRREKNAEKKKTPSEE